jgi:hypothetical protein
LGTPDKTRNAAEELEWIYGERNPIRLVFIAVASQRGVKALMIMRSDRERPVQ